MSNRKRESIGKIIFVGSGGVGKTSILAKLINNNFNLNTKMTEQPENYLYTTQIDNRVIKLVLWDTAGQEKYRAINRTYYRNSIGAFIVVDVQDKDVEKSISNWTREIKKNLDTDEVEIIILFNKCDLEEGRIVSQEQITNIQNEEGLKCFEVSALNGLNIKDSIEYMTDKVKNKLPQNEIQQSHILSKDNNNKSIKESSSCC